MASQSGAPTQPPQPPVANATAQGAARQPLAPLSATAQVTRTATQPTSRLPSNASQRPAAGLPGPNAVPPPAQRRVVSAPATLFDFNPALRADSSGRLIVPGLTIGQLTATIEGQSTRAGFAQSILQLYDPERFMDVRRLVQEMNEGLPGVMANMLEYVIMMYLRVLRPQSGDLVAAWCQYQSNFGEFAPKYEDTLKQAKVIWILVKVFGIGVLLPLSTVATVAMDKNIYLMKFPKIFGLDRFMSGALRKAAKVSKFRERGYDDILDAIGREEVKVTLSERMYGRIDEFYAGFVEVEKDEAVRESTWTTEVEGEFARFTQV